jgi:Tfp pilus assembly protein PilN
MATKEMTHLGTYVVPKVNLLPPEIDELKAQRRAYVAMGAVVVATIGAVGFLYAAQTARVGKAEDELASVKRAQSKLTVERQKLAHVDETFAKVDANEALLKQAVEKRIRWSRNLHDLSLTMPDNVWLEKLTIAQETDSEKSGKADKDAVLADPGLGIVTFEGRGFKHDDVAAWLDAMAKIKGYMNPYFSISKGIKPKTPAEKFYVEFEGTTTISEAALQSAPKSVTK